MRLYKIIALLIHVLLGVLLTFFIIQLLRIPSQDNRYRRLVQWWHSRVCKILNVEISVVGEPLTGTTLYVSNHISWLDIPLLASVVNPYFLSKAEVRDWPIIGWLAQQTGTLFIKRGCRSAAHNVHQEIVGCLKPEQGQASNSVLLFPEGTTSNGHNILRFRSRLFKTAIEAQTVIQPITLYFPDKLNGVNPVVPFIDKQPLSSNVWGLLGAKSTLAEVHFLEPIESDDGNYKEIATKAEGAVRNQLIDSLSHQKSIVSNSNPAEYPT